MIKLFKQGSKRIESYWQQWQCSSVPLVRPTLDVLARPETELPALVEACPVASKYLKLLGGMDWSHFPVRDPQGSGQGQSHNHVTLLWPLIWSNSMSQSLTCRGCEGISSSIQR